MYESNPRNANFVDLPFDDDQRLIDRRWIYCVIDNILELLNNIVETLDNGLIIDGLINGL